MKIAQRQERNISAKETVCIGVLPPPSTKNVSLIDIY
jgi:hypothetical protein